MGRPIFTTPNVPEERLQALRDAFDQMVVDPAFIEAAANEGLSVIPVSGAQLQQTAEEIISTPPDVAARLSEFIGVAQ
jgi:tripartite-type tricarboxylate transporter receptor subunit TctC